LRLADLGGHHRSPGKDHQGVERALIDMKQQKAGFVFFLLKFLRDALLFNVDWFKATGSNCVLMHRC